MVGVLALGGLTACASIVSPAESTVQIRTNPERAHCELKGQGGYKAAIDTPSAVSIPAVASPVYVTCQAEGFRPTTHTLDATADGWIWGNSAFAMATGGVAILGALVDESRSAGKSYVDEVQYDLFPDRPRPVRARSRTGDVDLKLRAR